MHQSDLNSLDVPSRFGGHPQRTAHTAVPAGQEGLDSGPALPAVPSSCASDAGCEEGESEGDIVRQTEQGSRAGCGSGDRQTPPGSMHAQEQPPDKAQQRLRMTPPRARLHHPSPQTAAPSPLASLLVRNALSPRPHDRTRGGGGDLTAEASRGRRSGRMHDRQPSDSKLDRGDLPGLEWRQQRPRGPPHESRGG